MRTGWAAWAGGRQIRREQAQRSAPPPERMCQCAACLDDASPSPPKQDGFTRCYPYLNGMLMTSLRQQYTHEIPLSEQGINAGQALRFPRKRQQAGKQGLASDSEGGSRLRGWRIDVPFSTAAASTSSTAARCKPHSAGKSARVYSQHRRCQAKSLRLITRPDHVSAGFASYVSCVYTSRIGPCAIGTVFARMSRVMSVIRHRRIRAMAMPQRQVFARRTKIVCTIGPASSSSTLIGAWAGHQPH